jgi:hypothetical protein
MKSIFISHSHSDHRLAKRLQSLLEDVSDKKLQIHRSSESGAIKTGEDWRAWINEKVLSCDFAVVLLTPSSFRGRWVLWEAGAVAGVQYQQLASQGQTDANKELLKRRVRVLTFNVGAQDLGPFASTQAVDGLRTEQMVTFGQEVLKDCLDFGSAMNGLVRLEREVQSFVKSAREDLRYTPIDASEGIVQDWLGRIDERAAKDDAWIIAAKRWINVAFLGAGQAHAHDEAIDFRIHVRIAAAHRRQRQWLGVVEQLKLAATLSPNDMVVLRDLGRAHRELGDLKALADTMDQMKELDSDVFKKDREGIALRCGYFSILPNWLEVEQLLSAADPTIVSRDTYLANWHALAVMKAHGAEKSRPRFVQLKDLVKTSGNDFWNMATLINAHLALNELDDAKALLRSLSLREKSAADVESATRFYDEILASFGLNFDWRAAAGLPSR